jgi:hypothetical protein
MVQLRAERKAGVLLREMPGLGEQGGNRKSSSSVKLENLGITKTQSHRTESLVCNNCIVSIVDLLEYRKFKRSFPLSACAHPVACAARPPSPGMTGAAAVLRPRVARLAARWLENAV